MSDCEKKIKQLEKEKKDILHTAQFVSFRVSDEFKDKSEREDVLQKLQQWRRCRVAEIDKEIQELKVQARETAPEKEREETEKLPKEDKEEPPSRTPTPHPAASPTTPAVAPADPFSMFNLPSVPDGSQVQVHTTPFQFQPPLSSGSCMSCPGCGAGTVWECNCDGKQWLKDWTAS